MKKIVIISLSLVVCLIIVAALLLKLNINIFNESDLNNKSTEQNTISATTNDSDQKFFHAKLEEGAKARIVAAANPDGSDNTFDLEISFNKLSVSKEKGDFDLIKNHNKEVIDENCTITNGYSYVVMNVTLSNISGQEFETTLNNMLLCANNISEYFELRSYNSDQNIESDKDYYVINFTKKFKQNYNLVYIIDDNILNNNSNKELLLLCSFVNRMPDLENIPIVKKN